MPAHEVWKRPELARRFDRPQTRYPLCHRTQSVAELSKALIDSYFCDAASLAHCQNFSAAGLRRPFVATMPTENGFGSGVKFKNFTRFPKLYPKSTATATPVPASTADMTPDMLSCSS